MIKTNLDSVAKNTLQAEANELMDAAERVSGAVVKAAEFIRKHEGKVVVCGLGKSGLIAQKMVATLCCTGT